MKWHIDSTWTAVKWRRKARQWEGCLANPGWSARAILREVIQRVTEAEAEAKRFVAAATAEAERIVSDANKQGEQLVAQARQEAKAEVNRLVEAAILGAEWEKQERLACLAAEIKEQVCLTETNRQRAVAGSVRGGCGKPYLREHCASA